MLLCCGALEWVRHSYNTKLRDLVITGRLYLENTNLFGGVLEKKKVPHALQLPTHGMAGKICLASAHILSNCWISELVHVCHVLVVTFSFFENAAAHHLRNTDLGRLLSLFLF